MTRLIEWVRDSWFIALLIATFGFYGYVIFYAAIQ